MRNMRRQPVALGVCILFRILGVGCYWFLAGWAHALPATEWRMPACPMRAVFRVPDAAGGSVMLRVPRIGDMPAAREGFSACNTNGAPLPLRVVHADGDEVVLLIEAPPSGARFCEVYYGGGGGHASPAVPEAGMDRTPMAVGFTGLSGRGIPTSPERLRHMLKWPRTVVSTPLRAAGFDEIAKLLKQDDDHRKTKGGGGAVRLAVVRSFLLCRRAGAYRFAVDCKDGGFVEVDGAQAAAWPGEHAPGGWQRGGPVWLEAGVHRLEVFHVFGGDKPWIRVGWMPPDGREITPLAATELVASCEVMATRVERMDRTLHPAFTATPTQAYSFRGNSTAFVAVRFSNNTENWVTRDMRSAWQFGDGAKSAEMNPVHVYRQADVFKVTLEVRDALGFVAGCSESVDCRAVQAEEYAVASALTGLPPVCFGRDKVAPFLRIQGAGPSQAPLELSWEVRRRSGASERDRRQVAPQAQAQFISLPAVTAGDLDFVQWQVSCQQVRLDGERIRFVRPPFDAAPDRIEGDRLYDAGGDRLVLLPEEGLSAFRQKAAGTGRSLGHLVCVDDSLAVPGLVDPEGERFDQVLARLLKGRIETVRYAALPDWQRFQGSHGPLRKLVDVSLALRQEPADVAILSVALRDMLAAGDVAGFEREAAALSDAVAALPCRMVWVTPPPYPSMLERSREFAAAIRRVAEARGIPVADLYTVFQCAADRRHVFFRDNPLVLSDQGHRLTAQQIVRALMGERKGSR